MLVRKSLQRAAEQLCSLFTQHAILWRFAVVQGLDTVKKISNVPSDRPSFRPNREIHTLKVQIVEKETPKQTSTGS